jgi:hypothetical protein
LDYSSASEGHDRKISASHESENSQTTVTPTENNSSPASGENPLPLAFPLKNPYLHSGAKILNLSHKILCIVAFWDFEKPNPEVFLLFRGYRPADSLQMQTGLSNPVNGRG